MLPDTPLFISFFQADVIISTNFFGIGVSHPLISSWGNLLVISSINLLAWY
jgi:hypothetical protein